MKNDKKEKRYETTIDDQTAFIRYEVFDGGMDMFHTQVPPGLRGRGIGTSLVRFALDDARRHRLKVIPSCSFIRDFVKKHPEYEDVLASRRVAGY